MKSMRIKSALLVSLCFFFSMVVCANPDARVMVLDFQLNDLTELPNAPDELKRVQYLTSRFKEDLVDKGLKLVPAPKPLTDVIAQNSATYLFDHPDVAAKLAESSADYVIIAVAFKPTYLFVYPRLLLVDTKKQKVVMPTYAQLESSWSDNATTARTAEYLASKIKGKLMDLMGK